VAEPAEHDWASVVREAAAALSVKAGTRVVIGEASPVSEGWTARHGESPGVRRCVVSGLDGTNETSVILKVRRPASDGRAGAGIARQRVALTMLQELGTNVGPRVIAHGEGFLVLEDLGCGAAVEDVLVGDDAAAAATEALVAFARALGAMQAASVGLEAVFRSRLAEVGVDTSADRVTLAGAGLAERWARLRELPAEHAALPEMRDADADIEGVATWLAEPGPLLAMSSGDLAPQNCRLGDGSVRLLDFEEASYRHLMLDVASLRMPFCAAPCWGRLPVEVSDAMEAVLREEIGRVCPAVVDARTYASGMAAATAVWAVTRLVRLPKLLAGDEPHPMGFSRRGQLLDTIQCAVDAAAAACTLDGLRGWFEQTMVALRGIWPGLPARQALYPTFRGQG
jgi:Phosphotransferase enzyme family